MNTEKQVIKTIARLINDRVDFKFIPEGLEQVIFEIVTDQLLSFIVDRTDLKWDSLSVVISSTVQLTGENAEGVSNVIAAEINEAFDIPFFNEEQELMIISAFIGVLVPLLGASNKTELVR